MEYPDNLLQLVMAGLGVDRLAIKAACLDEDRLQKFKEHVMVAYRHLAMELGSEARKNDPNSKLCLEIATEVMRDVKRLRAVPPPQMRVSFKVNRRG
jgi:hypothetical protein